MQSSFSARVAAFGLMAVGCTRREPAAAPPRGSVADAASHVETLERTTEMRVGAGEICAWSKGQRGVCMSRIGVRKDEPRVRTRVVDVSDAVEVSGPCTRDAGGRVRCDGRVVAEGVRSLAAFPYVLTENGTVLVLDEGDADILRARTEAVAPLVAVKKVVRGSHAACALFEDGRVRCWIEPWTFSFGSSVKARTPRVRPVPNVVDAVDVSLSSWMHLCVRTRTGTILCSSPAPEPADACVPQGDGARCGLATRRDSPRVTMRGKSFDPADLLARPLEMVVEGASEWFTFLHPAVELPELTQHVELSDVDPGGCAVRGRAIVCWNRSPCAPGRRWTISEVEGLPGGARLAALGNDWGYAIDGGGQLFAFPRRDKDPSSRGDDALCDDKAFEAPTIHTARVSLPLPVRSVAGGTVSGGTVSMSIVPGGTVSTPTPPGTTALDCAALRDGSIHCWTAARAQLGAPFSVPLP